MEGGVVGSCPDCPEGKWGGGDGRRGLVAPSICHLPGGAGHKVLP